MTLFSKFLAELKALLHLAPTDAEGIAAGVAKVQSIATEAAAVVAAKGTDIAADIELGESLVSTATEIASAVGSAPTPVVTPAKA